MTYHEAMMDARRGIITRALIEAGGSRTLAAQQLALGRPYLQKLVRDLGVPVPATGRGVTPTPTGAA